MNPSDKETEIILTQWKTCVDAVESVSRRRDTLNNLFSTLNLAAICAVTSFKGDTQIWFPLPIAGIIFCMVWWYLLRSYKQLNSAKFEVINDLELKLPMHPYKDEWQKLTRERRWYHNYICFTPLMKILPIVFGILYFLILIT